MSDLKRAVGAKIKEKLDIAVFADDAANHSKAFPCVEVSSPSGYGKARGFTGRTSFYRYDGEGHPTHAVKLKAYESVIRLTAKAKAQADGSSQAKCSELIGLVRSMFEDIVDSDTPETFTDPVTIEAIGIRRINIGASTSPALDESGEPLLHVATLDVTIFHRGESARPMTTFIDSVQVKHEVLHV